MGFLQGKTVIITGGGRATLADGSCGSIGYGIATAYAKEGANIVITGRKMINEIDDQMKELFLKRMEVVSNVALYKKENNMPIFDSKREESMKERLSKDTGEMKEYYLNFLEAMLVESKKYQEELLYGRKED